MAEPQRGEVWFAHLGPPAGRELAAERPVVILKNDDADFHGVTIVVPFTSQLRRYRPRITVRVPAGEGGLREHSLALSYNVRALDIAKLSHRLGRLHDERLTEIEDSLSFVLGLG